MDFNGSFFVAFHFEHIMYKRTHNMSGCFMYACTHTLLYIYQLTHFSYKYTTATYIFSIFLLVCCTHFILDRPIRVQRTAFVPHIFI